MENEIKVNDYVRLKDGTIVKVIEIKNQNTDILNWYCLDNDMGTMDRSIVKHSPKLIDLIECGDYVNGEKVEKIAEPSLANDYNRLIYCNECEGLYKLILFNKDIKEIVTKEMMESISYKVTKM